MICPVCYPAIEDAASPLAFLLLTIGRPARRPIHTPEQLRQHHPDSSPDCPACQTWSQHTPAHRAVHHHPDRPRRQGS